MTDKEMTLVQAAENYRREIRGVLEGRFVGQKNYELIMRVEADLKAALARESEKKVETRYRVDYVAHDGWKSKGLPGRHRVGRETAFQSPWSPSEKERALIRIDTTRTETILSERTKEDSRG